MLECLCVHLAVALGYHSVGDTLLGVDDETNVGHYCLAGVELAALATDLVLFDVGECLEVLFFVVVVALYHRDGYLGTGSVLQALMAAHLHFPSDLVAPVVDLSYATNSIWLHLARLFPHFQQTSNDSPTLMTTDFDGHCAVVQLSSNLVSQWA